MEGKAEGFVHETYDAVWAIALTIQRVQSIVDITQFDYGRKDIAQLFSDHMGQLNFDGVSVSIFLFSFTNFLSNSYFYFILVLVRLDIVHVQIFYFWVFF